MYKRLDFIKSYLPLILILCLAGFLRMYQTELEFFGGDDAYISIKALQIARYGEHHFLGPPSSLGLVHSPLSVYLYALPYFFTPEPVGAQIFTAAINTLSVAILYFITIRYFGFRAAVVASLLYAVHPHMVFASRVINNAQIGAPFVLMFVFTGLLGYYDNKGWARILHLPLLSLAGQCHPHTFALLPLSLCVFIHSILSYPKERRIIVMQTILSGIIFILLFVPWIIGVYEFSQYVNILERVQNMPSTGEIQDNQLFGGLGQIIQTIYHMERVPDNWLKPFQALITIVGSIWMAYNSFVRRRLLPGFTIVLSFALVPIVTWIIQAHWVIDYWWPSLPGLFVIQGALLGGVTKNVTSLTRRSIGFIEFLLNNIYYRTLAIGMVALISISQIIQYIQSNYPPPPVSLNELVDSMDLAVNRALSLDKDLMIILSEGHGGLPWAFLREYAYFKYDIEGYLVEFDQPLPLLTDGAVLVGDGKNDSRASLFSEGEFVYGNSMIALLPESDKFETNAQSILPWNFANNVNVLGFYIPSTQNQVTQGETWTIFMIMETRGPVTSSSKVYVHLVDRQGVKYAQLDQRGLNINQISSTQRYASQFELSVSNELPDEGNLYLNFGMYDDNGNVPLVADNGSTIDEVSRIQIRGLDESISMGPEDLQLLRLDVSSQIMQGVPLILSANWYTNKVLDFIPKLRWHIYDTNDDEVYIEDMDIFSNPLYEVWPKSVFVEEQYELRIPTDLESGNYVMDLGVFDSNQGKYKTIYSTDFDVLERERIFVLSDDVVQIQGVFGNKIEMLGYNLYSNEDSLEVQMYWRPIDYIDIDYKYFVHVRHNGEIIAQIDSMPQEWTYPTSWWSPGEIVLETVKLDISADLINDTSLSVGFYNPSDGERLTVTDLSDQLLQSDWIVLPQLNE